MLDALLGQLVRLLCSACHTMHEFSLLWRFCAANRNGTDNVNGNSLARDLVLVKGVCGGDDVS